MSFRDNTEKIMFLTAISSSSSLSITSSAHHHHVASSTTACIPSVSSVDYSLHPVIEVMSIDDDAPILQTTRA